MKKVVLVIICTLAIVVLTAGCVQTTVTTNTTNNKTSSASPTVQVATSTPTPLPTIKSDYSSTLNNNPGWLGNGFVVSSSFHKTTVNGKACYVGTLNKLGYSYKMQVFPMNSYLEALNYREQLISNFKAQGYYTVSANNGMWTGASENGNSGAAVQTMEMRDIGPVTWSGIVTLS